ncbi:MAG TPA: YCF48-related protein [Polyangiaceae bacterium]|nr:YCF48-related protein [Polyangiaceae bacterium]
MSAAPESNKRVPAKFWLLGAGAILLGLALVRGRHSEGESSRAGARVAPATKVSALELAPPLALPVRVANSHLTEVSFMPDRQTAIALGSEGTVLRSADDGQSWQSIETGTRETLRDSVVHPASGTLVIVGSHGTVLRSSDAGQSFSKAALDSELGLRAVALSARSSLLVAVGDDGSACVSRDSAQKFVSEPTGTRHSLLKLLALPNSDRVLAAGDNGSLLVREERGAWRTLTTPATKAFSALYGTSDGALLAASQDGVVLISVDRGESWQSTLQLKDGAYVVGFESDASGAQVVGRTQKGKLVFSADRGRTFEELGFEPGQGLARLVWLEKAGFVGLGALGARSHSDLSGKNWTIEPAPELANPSWLEVAPATGTVLAVGESALIARSADKAKSYRVVGPGLGGAVRAFAYQPAHRCLIGVGESATVVKSLDGGQQWTRIESGLDPKLSLTSITATGSPGTFVASGSAGLLRSGDCGDSWLPIPATKANLTWLLRRGETLIALGKDTKIQRSTDGGRTFHAARMETAWLTRAVSTGAKGALVAVGAAGAIYRSTDEGESFQRVASNTDVTLHAISFDEVGNALWAAGDGGTLLRSADGGASWQKITTPSKQNLFAIGAHPGQKLVLVGGDAGTLLSTSDAGKTFVTLLTKSTRAIRTIAFEPRSNEFFVAGDGGDLLRTVERERLAPVAGTFEGRIDTAFYHEPSRAMILGGERLLRIGAE